MKTLCESLLDKTNRKVGKIKNLMSTFGVNFDVLSLSVNHSFTKWIYEFDKKKLKELTKDNTLISDTFIKSVETINNKLNHDTLDILKMFLTYLDNLNVESILKHEDDFYMYSKFLETQIRNDGVSKTIWWSTFINDGTTVSLCGWRGTIKLIELTIKI